MKNKKPNYLKHILQWGVLAAIAATVAWGAATKNAVDPEAYCPFGGLQALGSYLRNDSLACTMSMVQIAMGVALAVCVVLFSRLFCGYLCPLGTLSEYMGKAGRKMHLHVDVRRNSVADKLLRAVKYVLLFVILYFSITSSELFCKHLDPYYAMATGFKGEITPWMVAITMTLLFAGSFVVDMFWCRYVCPLGALSNIFKMIMAFIPAVIICWILAAAGIEGAWVWVLAATCLVCYAVEIFKHRTCLTPLLHVTRDVAACNGCRACAKKCPYKIDVYNLDKVKDIDCTLCGNCISACATDALQINSRRGLRWIPGIIIAVLFAAAMFVGTHFELPTIDETWGDADAVENMQTYRQDGLSTIKCYGSSKAFSAKMQRVPGVYGVRTFVRRHGVEVAYDPAKTDTVEIRRAIFTPFMRKYALPAEGVDSVRRVVLGIEGLYDRMDVIYLGMMLQKVEGLYGMTSEFGCPVKVTLYVDPSREYTRKDMRETVEAPELDMSTPKKRNIIPMSLELKTFAVEDMVPRAEFASTMFADVARMSGKFVENVEKYGDDAAFPKGVYEMEYPYLEKLPIRSAIPYFKSFLSCCDGITAVDFVLKGDTPAMRITYVRSLWDDARLWDEIFTAETWTLRYADGTFKESEPRMEFETPGHSVE